MSLDQWRSIFELMLSYADHLETSQSHPVRSRLILHGGEPLVLPLSYLSDVFAVKDEVLNAYSSDKEHITCSLQSNLFHLSDAHVKFIKKNRISVGVSFDGIEGTRVTIKGMATEETVLKNFSRLQKAGVSVGFICVAAKHTIPHLANLYSFFESTGCSLRFLPVFDVEEHPNQELIAVTDLDEASYWREAFSKWIGSSRRISVSPFQDWLEVALSSHQKIPKPRINSRKFGASVIVVNTNGDLYRIADVYKPQYSLGEVSETTTANLLGSEAYIQSLDREEALLDITCNGCEFRNACSGVFAVESRLSGNRRCGIHYQMIKEVDNLLSLANYSPDMLASSLHQESNSAAI